MKKLVISVAVLSVAAFACVAEEAAAPAPQPAQAAVQASQRPKFDRAKFEERMRQRRAEMRARVTEILRAAGVADEKKAEALAEEIDQVYTARPQRPQRPEGPRGMRGPRPSKAPAAQPAPNAQTEQK